MKKLFTSFLFLTLISFALFSQASQAWQTEVSFPDWITNTNFSANNSLAFQFFHGQGKIELEVSNECKSFSLYINDNRVSTKKFKSGGTYTVDISKFTTDGRNFLQVSDIKPADLKNAVRVRIPYPEVLEGSLKKSGLSRDSFSLIDKIICADIKNGFTSAQLAVIKDSRLVYQNVWGNATNETLYDLASVSKMFTAAYAVQFLVTQGLLSVDTKLVDIFGEDFSEQTISVDFAGKEPIPLEKIKDWKKNLTVRDVLCHSAGFSAGYPYFNDNYDLEKNEFNVAENKNALFSGNDGSEETREYTLQQIFRTPLIYEPGTKLVYSDIDFMILCFVVERVSGERLDVFLKKNFWEPLNLERITFNPLENGFSKSDCAPTDLTGNSYMGELSFTGCRTDMIQGEVHDGNAFYAMGGISGHAGLFASATDLARLASIMLTGGYKEHRFFSRNVIDLFTSPQSIKDADYGFGWWRGGEMQNVRNFGSLCSSRAFGHNGFTGTVVFVEPEENLVIVYLTNKINTSMPAPEALNNQFEGNFYQSANLGFVPQIILLGLNRDVSKSQWKSLVSGMAEDARRKAEKEAGADKNDVRWKAYQALESVLNQF
ncbi:serine hydrolase [uncultured Treponema sp.]|uniref:serine hydrolase n=1 Tax=uncultured Treponema sp. TaxID=162155 RepID=UPI0025D6E7E5|nr:serine hydrolase [uncultured Treponema sp.]